MSSNSDPISQTYIQNFANVFPNIILNTVDYEKIIIPKYLGLSITHVYDIKNIIKNYYEKLRPYYKNLSVSSVLYNVQYKTKNLLLLINEIPFLTASSNNNSIFDVRLTKLLLKQFLLILFMEYVNLANNESMLFGVDIQDQQSKKNVTSRTPSKTTKKN